MLSFTQPGVAWSVIWPSTTRMGRPSGMSISTASRQLPRLSEVRAARRKKARRFIMYGWSRGLKSEVVSDAGQDGAEHGQAHGFGLGGVVFLLAEVHAVGVAAGVYVVDAERPGALPAALGVGLALEGGAQVEAVVGRHAEVVAGIVAYVRHLQALVGEAAVGVGSGHAGAVVERGRQ